MRRRISRAQQTKNWCVGFSFPPPAYAGIHPTLYLFGFRADALNSHSLALIQGLVSSASIPFQDLPERLWAFPVVAFGAPKPSGGLRGLWGAFGGLWCPCFRVPLRPLEASRGPLRAPPGCLRVPPGASGRLRGASGGLGAFFWVCTLGLVVGFAFFGLRPQPPAWRIPNFSIFQATSWRRLASGPPERRPENPRHQGCWV